MAIKSDQLVAAEAQTLELAKEKLKARLSERLKSKGSNKEHRAGTLATVN